MNVWTQVASRFAPPKPVDEVPEAKASRRKGSRVRRTSRAIRRTTASMPFAGKSAVKNVVVEARTAHDPRAKVTAAAKLAGVMGFMQTAHGVQAVMGVQQTLRHADLFIQNPSVPTAVACVIDTAYAAANGAVMFTHANVTTHVVKDLWHRRDELANPERTRLEARPPETPSGKDVAVTLAGQGAFLATTWF